MILDKSNFKQPNPFFTLSKLDSVSNDCCKILDSAQLVYR